VSAPSPPSLTVTASATDATPDGAPVALHAVVTGADTSTPTWTIVSGPGTLSASTGADIQYIPPSAEAFDQGGAVNLSVQTGLVEPKTLTIALAAANVPGHHWSTFNTSAVQWRGVASDGHLYVAFGDKGRLSTSPDGQTWTARDTGTNDWFTAAARGDDGWLVIGGNHSLLHSDDGIAWTALTQKLGTAWPMSATNLAFGNGRFVAAGYYGSFVATDINNWTATAIPLSSVAFGNGAFVAVTSDDHLARSTDGLTWISAQSTSVGSYDAYHAVAFVNGVFAVNANGGFITSVDGLAWSAPGASHQFRSVYATQNTFFTTCPSPLYGDDLCVSADASQFFDQSPNNSIDPFAGVAGDATTWVRVSNYGSIEWNPQSSDHWQTAVAGSVGDLVAIDYVAGRYVALSSVGWAMSSADGQSWDSAYTSPFSGHPGEAFTPLSLAHRGDVLVAAGLRATSPALPAGELVVSSDGGQSWAIASDEASPVRAVIDDGQRFVAVGDGGVIYASADGHAWSTLATLPGVQSLSSIAYGLGRYVAVGPKGALATSPDGAAWTVVTPPADEAGRDYLKVIFDGQRFVRLRSGDFDTVQTSTDGQTWTLQTPLTSGRAVDLVYHDGEYVMLQTGGQIFTSRDLQTWKWRTLVFENDVRAVAFCNGRFMAVGANALILEANQ
jgi:hypothetical protein